MKVGALILISLFGFTCGSNILVMLPLPFYSHTIAFMPVIEGLASRGHNVTFVSAVPMKKPVKNINYIPVDYKLKPEMNGKLFVLFYQLIKYSFFIHSSFLWKMPFGFQNSAMHKSSFLKLHLINNDHKN